MGSRSALTVPVKQGNRPEGPCGGKGGAGDTELLGGKATEPPTSDTVFTRLQRIAELAREDPGRAFRSLAHHIDIELLHEAFRRTRKDGATGVDGQTGREYEQGLEGNLRLLHERFKSGQYKAPPVRRSYVPKGDGTQTRPIAIPAGTTTTTAFEATGERWPVSAMRCSAPGGTGSTAAPTRRA
jgi:hypothetical protein